jgi:hypothetical protein
VGHRSTDLGIGLLTLDGLQHVEVVKHILEAAIIREAIEQLANSLFGLQRELLCRKGNLRQRLCGGFSTAHTLGRFCLSDLGHVIAPVQR